MSKKRNWLFGTLAIMILVGLACGPSVSVPELDLPEVTVPAGVAQTAEAAAGQLGELAGTAAAMATAEGPAALATLQAAAGQVDIPVDLDILGEKFAGVVPDTGGDFSLTLTDAEVNQVIWLSLLASGGIASQLLNPMVAFSAGNVVFSADVTEPITARLSVTFRPYVEDGTLRFELLSATLADRQVPAVLLSGAEAALSGTLSKAADRLPDNVQLQQVVVGEGTMTFAGQIVN